MTDQKPTNKAIDDYMVALKREASVLDGPTRAELLIQVRQHFDETEAEGVDAQASIQRLGQPSALVKESLGHEIPTASRIGAARVIWIILTVIGAIWILTGAGILIGSLAIGASQGWLLISAAVTLLLGAGLTLAASRKLKRTV